MTDWIYIYILLFRVDTEKNRTTSTNVREEGGIIVDRHLLSEEQKAKKYVLRDLSSPSVLYRKAEEYEEIYRR